MNRYLIRYKQGHQGTPRVSAETVNGFKPTCDTYVFKIGEEVVALVPKANVASIIKSGESVAADIDETV